ncbi:MAG: hypothetical protein U5K69_17660 [Balneolaceae bacterium]|nr:hypothetical protein [Balneolaceae bacterium]
MDSDHLFNRDEISKIFKRAAELEHKDNIEDDSEGLTLQELQQVSTEVGIHPKYIQLAINQLQNPANSVTTNLLGGPFTYSYTDSARGSITEEVWEEIVSEIRKIHGGIGKTSRLGNTFEWEQRLKEVGYIQISLSPKRDHSKITIQANYNQHAFIVYFLSGAFSFMLLAGLLETLSLPRIIQIIVIASGVAGIFGAARFYLSHWINKKRKTYSTLFRRLKELLYSKSDNKNIPTTAVPSGDQYRDDTISAKTNRIRG